MVIEFNFSLREEIEVCCNLNLELKLRYRTSNIHRYNQHSNNWQRMLFSRENFHEFHFGRVVLQIIYIRIFMQVITLLVFFRN